MQKFFFTFTLFLLLTISLGYSLNEPYLHQVTHPVEHGEGPTWSERKHLLYFVDLHAGKILSYDPNEQEIHSIKLNGDVTTVVPSRRDPNLLIVAINRTVIAVEWDGKGLLEKQLNLVTVADEKPSSRFNDGKADSNGRLWFGTMGYENASGVVPNEGSLFIITHENMKNPEIKISPVNISNGLAWNKANDKFYYIDSPSRNIKEYDYDENTSNISNEKIAFDLNNHPQLGGVPDGMTIDEDDNLWIALYNGGCVIKVNPKTGKLLQVVAVPAQYVTSVAWGGPLFDTLYVTTSRFALTPEEKLRQPAAGSVFAITNLQTRGLPVFAADIIDYI